MADIFVSYSRKDIQRVKQIVEELHKAGFDYWMDKSGIRSGKKWTREITEAISACRIFLLFMSSTSMDSENVEREVHMAFKRKKKIIILRLDQVEIPSSMSYELEGIQWTDYSNPEWKTEILTALASSPNNSSNDQLEGVRPFQESRTTDGQVRSAARIALPLLAIILLLIAGYWFLASRNMLLWTFNQNTQAWQAEKQTQSKPEYAALAVDHNAEPASLQAEFDFGQVDPDTLSGDMEPRATFFVNGVNGDWSDFRTLTFDVENLTTHDLKVTFSVSNADCWYEFGLFQPLAKNEKKTLRFDMTQPSYKTCLLPGSYTNPAPPFDEVWRFDIIVGTDERPWMAVQGSILIDNVMLTGRVGR